MIISGVSGRVKGEERGGVDRHEGCGGGERALGQFQHSVFGHFVDAGACAEHSGAVKVMAKS